MRKTQTEISHQPNFEDLKHMKAKSKVKEPVQVEREIKVEVQVNVVSQPLNIVTDNLLEPSFDKPAEAEKEKELDNNVSRLFSLMKCNNPLSIENSQNI